MRITMLAALAVMAVPAAKALAATPASGGSFGNASPGRIEVNLTGGTMRQIACAQGGQPGARCYVAKG